MIYKVFPETTFREEAGQLAQRLAEMPTRGLAYTKKILSESFTSNLNDQLYKENIYQQKAAETSDYAEGVKSFMQKTKPVFTGS
jgi:2-(1,2-epoxy-1,2-dihydrophenyl)acetyl-CoA isomerase